MIESYAGVRQKRNAIAHGRWGKNVDGTLEFDYSYTDDLSSLQPRPTVNDVDKLVPSVTVAFAEFAALLSESLIAPSMQTDLVLSTFRHLSNQFRILHGLAQVKAGPDLLCRIHRVTDSDTFDFDEIVPAIKKIQPTAGAVRYDLVICRATERSSIPASETRFLNG